MAKSQTVVKIIGLLGVFILGMSLAVPASLADNYGIDEAQKATGGTLPTNVGGATNILELVGNIVAVGLSLIGIVFFGLILYAGFRWMTAMGKAEDVDKAKDTMEAAAMGLVVILAAYAISKFIFSSLGVGGGGETESNQCTKAGGQCMSFGECDAKDNSVPNAQYTCPDKKTCCTPAK